MVERALDNINQAEAAVNDWKVDAGDPSAWELVCKVSNDKCKMMKSTKRMKVPGGFIYQVTTEGPKGYAEALAFVPATPTELKPQKPIIRKPPNLA